MPQNGQEAAGSGFCVLGSYPCSRFSVLWSGVQTDTDVTAQGEARGLWERESACAECKAGADQCCLWHSCDSTPQPSDWTMCTILFSIVLHSIVQYCTELYSIVLYCIELYSIVQHNSLLYSIGQY